MNDRNAFLQGQGSPIRDDAAPPEQGWRGERAADEAAGSARRRRIEGIDADVEDISGTAFVEAGGADEQPVDSAVGRDKSMAPRPGAAAGGRPDGVSNLDMSADTPGGESAGAPYPHGKRRSKNDFGSRMGHAGQSGIGYHGTGHLGGQKVGDDDNRNGVAETDD